jgi:hypothetical protein
MARINVATLGTNLAGEFVVGAQLKIFGPHGRVERSDNQVDIELRPRGREYVGRLPQRRLFQWQGGVLQIIWKINYD